MSIKELNSVLIMPNELDKNQRYYEGGNEEKKDVDGAQVNAQESREYNAMLAEAGGQLYKLLSAAAGKDNVPAYNKHEVQGREGLIDPSLTYYQTYLPQMRRLDQASNYLAIYRSLPAALNFQNYYIVRAVETAVPYLQKNLKQSNSIYTTAGGNNFMYNKLNNDIQKRRVNSIYAVI